MSNKRINDNDAYDDLLRSFSASSKKSDKPQDEVRNHGEIYFSVNSPRPDNRQNNASASAYGNGYTDSSDVYNGKTAGTPAAPVKRKANSSKKKKKKKARRKYEGIFIALVIVVISFLSAFLIKTAVMSCVDDILAINASTVETRVTLDKNMNAYEVINILANKKLITNEWFCKKFADLRDLKEYENDEGEIKVIVYPAGTYDLSPSMGLEGMLLEIRRSGVDNNTVKVTFPEGFNVDQIAEKLEENEVCTAKAFYEAMNNDALFEKYEFLSSVTDKELRYRVLEGYLYPDTYEFYLGESASSVLERFLDNFEDKWTDEYQAKADTLGYTVDEILIVASILEKEAFDASQMNEIASVVYNRLESSSFPYINCDSTGKYIENFKEKLDEQGKLADYMRVYDTYQKTGLPIGAIGCPGADAISAALNPDNTDYYYFLHDKEGNLYLASTSSEHQSNINQYLN